MDGDILRTVIGGLLGGFLVGLVNIYRDERRLRHDRNQAKQDRDRDRRDALRPAVGELIDVFSAYRLMATPSWDHDEAHDPWPFDEAWPTAFENAQPRALRLILEIPDALVRDRLVRTLDALEWAGAAWDRTGVREERTYVRNLAGAGAEVAAAWLRGEDPDESAITRLAEAQAAVDEVEAEWAEHQTLRDEAAARERTERAAAAEQ